ncbi:hypothetical protein G6F31_017816 [Rhizopus arrhizus]|nr:hypothetical protein G6F31_017816 [Rhizopus arrhizus]
MPGAISADHLALLGFDLLVQVIEIGQQRLEHGQERLALGPRIDLVVDQAVQMQVALHQRPLQQAGVGGDTAEIPVAAIHQHVHKPLDGAEHQQRGHDAGNAYLQHHQRGGNAGQRAAEELKLFDVVRRGPAAHHVQQARIESQLEAEVDDRQDDQDKKLAKLGVPHVSPSGQDGAR